jgi:serine/threonine protein kinase
VELERPKKLLRLEEGVVFDDPGKTLEELARLSGFKENYQYKEEKKGDIINSSRKLEIWSDDERRKSFILKRFAELKSAKWAILDIWAIAAKHFNMSPLSRLTREVEAERRLHTLGIKTHHIVGVVLDERTLVSEFVEGEPLAKTVNEILSDKGSDTSHIEAYGRVLGKLHKNGLVYGDTKPENALVSKEGPIALLDLEQCVENGDPAWDLASMIGAVRSTLEKYSRTGNIPKNGSPAYP